MHDIARMLIGIVGVYALFSAPAFLYSVAFGETVTVKYRGDVPLDTFECWDVTRSSLVERVCYDEAEGYMIVRLRGTYYHYCEIDPSTVDEFLDADSMGRFFNAHIKGSGSDGPYDCRSRHVPKY